MSSAGGGYVDKLALTIGVSAPALRLLISTLLGYPLAFLYRRLIYRQCKLVNNLFILACGLLIILFNYGYDAYHSIVAIMVSYAMLKTLRGSVLIGATFIFHMSYLLIGYYVTGTDTYDITWTMPHCVLTLRLIGLSLDVSDGRQLIEKLSADNKKSCLNRVPNLLEIFAYTLFPASLLVGPQFPFRRFDSFINKDFDRYSGHFRAGLIRGGLGLIYLVLNQVGTAMIPEDYMLSPEYDNRSIIYKWLILGAWGKIVLYKYIACWMLSEGVATCFGLTFSGYVNGKEDWSGCANIKLGIFENAEKFQNYIDSFNVNTNQWVGQYVFKRLKFLGNRHISHGATLLFLAVWHGFHSGYYMCFFMEFAIMNFEKQIESVLTRNESFLNTIGSPICSVFIFVALKFYTLVGMGFCLVPFIYLSFGKWWQIYHSVWYYGFILYFPWPIYKAILKKLFPATVAHPHSK